MKNKKVCQVISSRQKKIRIGCTKYVRVNEQHLAHPNICEEGDNQDQTEKKYKIPIHTQQKTKPCRHQTTPPHLLAMQANRSSKHDQITVPSSQALPNGIKHHVCPTQPFQLDSGSVITNTHDSRSRPSRKLANSSSL